MILFVRDLTVIDFSYLCQQRGLLGESFIVDVELQGELDATSMVFDFGSVKKVIKKAIDQLIDHKLAYPTQAPCLNQRSEQHIDILQWQSARGLIQIASPAEAHVAIDSLTINEQSVAAFLVEKIKPLLPSNVQKLTFSLRAEKSSSFYYHYSHGLKKHDGNCQRIAHGHRSTIEIFQNGMLSPRLNKYWTERWQDIYLATAEDQIAAENCRYLQANVGDLCFQYQAPQGQFEMTIPAAHCEIVPCDTTVECLADYIAAQLQQLETGSYKVVAYEGVGKGAIAIR